MVKRTHEQTDIWSNGHMDKRTHGQTDPHGQTDTWSNGHMDKRTHGQTDIWTNGLMDKRTYGPPGYIIMKYKSGVDFQSKIAGNWSMSLVMFIMAPGMFKVSGMRQR